MAEKEYIEREALIRYTEKQEVIIKDGTSIADAMRIQGNVFRRCVETCPTADVVPREELDAMRGAANSYKMHYENAQTEVERLERILNYYALQYGTVKDQQEVTDRIKTTVAEQLLSDLKIEAHNKAVHPCGCKIDPYISLKVLDGIIQKYINEYYEEGKKI